MRLTTMATTMKVHLRETTFAKTHKLNPIMGKKIREFQILRIEIAQEFLRLFQNRGETKNILESLYKI